MTLLWISAVQSTVILLIAVSVLPLLRNRSAAFRHCVLASALLFCAATPAFNLLMPSWSVPASLAKAIPRPQRPVAPIERVQIAVPGVVPSSTLPAPVPAPMTRVPMGLVAMGIWLIGTLAGLFSLAIGLLRLRRLAFGSRPIDGTWTALVAQISGDYGLTRQVELLQSQNPSVLVTWGAIRHRVILPQGASSWPTDVADVVLRHELAHVRRHDWIVQMMAQSLRIVYWFNPLIWIVCRRLRLEAELACDDAVLVGNINGHEYASHLLDLARSLNTTDRAWSAVLTMARPSTLERRFTAMLNPDLNRNSLTRTAVLVTLLVGFGVTASLPAMKTFAAAPAQQVQARAQAVRPAPAAPATAAPPTASQVRPVTRAATALPASEPELARLVQEAAAIRPGTLPTPFPHFLVPAGAEFPTGEGAGMLIKLFDGTNDLATKQHILEYLGMSSNPQAAEKVLAIARSDANKDLKLKAIEFLAFRSDGFDAIVALYDASRDAETKKRLLDSLGMSRDPRASQKLFSIAQSDPDPNLRRTAIDYIAFR